MTVTLNDDARRELDHKLHAYLRGAAQRRPNSARSGPFLCTFDDNDDNVYLNYAIPDDDADPAPGDVEALVALFAARRRKPRFEYIGGAAPRLESALLAAGFALEGRFPAMLCRPGWDIRAPQTHGIEVFAPTAPDDLVATERAQSGAYGSPPRGPDGLKRTLRFGGVVAAARDIASGAIVGGGIATPPVAGVSEVAGIGVAEAFRRRGAAGVITALLARDAFAKGIELAWLTPGHGEAERIYARAGFVTMSEALHMSK